ncbi:MAG: Tm-1-like ATP-binding domain-containing protein [Thermodesulfobacteriota bacterium]
MKNSSEGIGQQVRIVWRVPGEWAFLKLFIPDAFRVQARTTSEELREIAREVARKLNRSKGPVAILLPLKGWSSLDKEGMPLYDPEADQAFIQELKVHLNTKIPIVELDLHLNTCEFAEETVNHFLKIYEEYKRGREKDP